MRRARVAAAVRDRNNEARIVLEFEVPADESSQTIGLHSGNEFRTRSALIREGPGRRELGSRLARRSASPAVKPARVIARSFFSSC